MDVKRLEQRLWEVARMHFPYRNKDRQIDITKLEIVPPPGLGDLDHELQLKAKGADLVGSVKARFVLTDLSTGKKLDESTITVAKIPFKTLRGTYLIGGNEKIIWNQLRLRKGAYTFFKGPNVETQIMLNLGKSTILRFKPEEDRWFVEIGQQETDLVPFLKIFGVTDDQIRAVLKGAADRHLKVDYAKAVRRLHKKLLPYNEFKNTEQAAAEIRNYYEKQGFGSEGEKAVKLTMGKPYSHVTGELLLTALKRMVDLAHQDETGARPDDKDDMRFQHVVTDEDFIVEKFEEGIVESQRKMRHNLETGNKIAGEVLVSNAFNKPISEFMSKGDVVEYTEQTNPLHMLSSQRRVTQLGEGALTIKQATLATRNIQNNGFGRIDPVETQESQKIGLVGHMAVNATVKNGSIVTPYYPIRDGAADTTKVVELSAEDEYNHKIAFNDPSLYERKGNRLVLKHTKIPVRYQNQIMEADWDDVDFIDVTPHAHLNFPANMIPFVHHDDGNRMLMGANMQKQAIPLVKREAPLVQTAVDETKQKTYEQLVAEIASQLVESPVDGTVKKITETSIIIADNDGKEHKVLRYDYFPLNHDNFIHNEPLVKVGDKVKKGQLLAKGWHTDDNGTLALGLNVRVAYMPYKGYNFEDGFVISESLAERMTSEEIRTIDVPIREGHVGGPGSHAKMLEIREGVSPALLAHLDEDGIVRPKTDIKAGDILVCRLEPVNTAEMSPEARALAAAGMLRSVRYNIVNHVHKGFMQGKVIDVRKISGAEAKSPEDAWIIRISVAVRNKMKVGDKLAGRHGNKGTVTLILPDEKMPRTPDGKPVELIISPLTVPSRKNLGQLYEVNAGLVAEKTGKPWIVYNYDKNEGKRVEKALEEIGIPDGKMILINPETGKPYENPVTVGQMYVMKLKHKVDEKFQARSIGDEHFIYHMPKKITGQPAGEKRSPQKLGEFEFRALQAHKAVYNILESTTLKSDGVQDRVALFQALRAGGRDLPEPATPVSLQVFSDKLKALGLNMVAMKGGKPTPKDLEDAFEELLLVPIKPEQVKRMAPKEVTKARAEVRLLDAVKPEPGGLFDPAIFGETEEEHRRMWGRIDLAAPIPNPLYLKNPGYNPYAILTGLQPADIKRILETDSVVITNPGDTGLGMFDIISVEEANELRAKGKKFEYKVHGEALEAMLARIDVEQELKRTEKALKTASKAEQRDYFYKKYRILKNLHDNNLRATDFLLKSIPVLPVGLRPISRPQGDKAFEQIDDANTLYSRLIRRNQQMKEFKEANIKRPKEELEYAKSLYKRVSDLFGYDGNVNIDHKTYTPIFQTFRGKTGIIRGRLLAKYVDYSARSVISVDPTLKINQAGLPIEMAMQLYKPFVLNKLRMLGIARNEKEALDKWKAGLKNPTEDVMRALEAAVKERPILLNRQPSLHKFSILAFEPVLRKAQDGGRPPRSIALNPLVTTGFGADFDGDTMAVHVPITPEAVEEANRLMMPSENLINPTNGELVPLPKHEMLLGLFYLTKNLPDKPNAKISKFASYKELETAFFQHKINAHDLVELNGRTGTVGKHLVYGLLPKRLQEKAWESNLEINKNTTESLLKDIIANEGTQTAVILLDEFKRLGFNAATKSGLSIGLKDLVIPEKRDELLEEAAKMVEKDPSSVIAVYSDVQAALEDEVAAELQKINSPIYYMISSGARGKKSEVRAMAGILGLSKDITQKVIEKPVLSSFKEGLAPYEFWIHAYDARRGLASRSLSTAEPGALTREIYHTTQDVIVAIKDCNDTIGLHVPKFSEDGRKTNQWKTLVGRFLARPVGPYPAKTLITRKIYAALDGDKSITEVWVRSPVKCRASAVVNRPNVICQMCYGTISGTNDLPVIGEPVGAIAAQAIGEPASQGQLSAFHTSGIAGAQVAAGVPRIKELFDMTSRLNPAEIAKHDGMVSIEETPTHWLIRIGSAKTPQKVSKNKKLIVSNGQTVKKGDRLTYGDYDPTMLFAIKGLDETQEYLVRGLDDAMALSGLKVDPKHLEVVVGRLTNKAIINKRGNSPFIEGQIVDRAIVEEWNAKAKTMPVNIPISDVDELVGAMLAKDIVNKRGVTIARKGETLTESKLEEILSQIKDTELTVFQRPAQFSPRIYSLTTNPFRDENNWLGQVGFENPARTLARASAFGEKEKFEEPRSRYMAGKPMNVGTQHFTEFMQQRMQSLKDKVSKKLEKASKGFLGFFGI